MIEVLAKQLCPLCKQPLGIKEYKDVIIQKCQHCSYLCSIPLTAIKADNIN